jgi:mRNA interferase RelE/StbE
MKIVYDKVVYKILTRMPANEARRIHAKIEQYAANPESQANNVKKLQGRVGYRMRVGDWRVIFRQDGDVMTIAAIGPRGGVYDR